MPSILDSLYATYSIPARCHPSPLPSIAGLNTQSITAPEPFVHSSFNL